MGIWYCTREDVKGAADIAETAYANARIDRAIEAASRAVEKLCHRVFYPTIETRRFDWPDAQAGTPWRLWLNQNELASVTSVTSSGIVIASGDYELYPDSGPPYNRIEIDLGSSASFGGGDTYQKSVVIVGEWCGCELDTDPAGRLAAAIATTDGTTVDVTDSASIGVGQLIRVGDERMVVTGKTMLTTGQTLQAPMTADTSNTTCVVEDGSEYFAGEVLLLGGERVLVEDIADDTLIVKRAWDGSVLTAHAASTIYARRRLTVERGVLGTTAATHSSATPITKHVPPGPVHRLAVAEAQTTLAQESAQWARQIGTGENAREAWSRGLKDAREECYAGYGRKARIRAVG
jgi:hypothetical protein